MPKCCGWGYGSSASWVIVIPRRATRRSCARASRIPRKRGRWRRGRIEVTTNPREDSDRQGHSPGAFLREARLAQSLAVADVARQLKLSTNQVEALEAGEFARLPGPVFVRGFVRNYARLLRLEVEPLVEAVASKLPREDPLPAPPSVDVPFP